MDSFFAIIIATVVITVLGLLIGMALVAAGNKFHVEVDPREEQVRANLPGNNCGACGFAGCDAVAAAIASGSAPANACPICSQDALNKISEVMGVEANEVVPMEAYVHCAGTCGHVSQKINYVGIQDCRAAVLSGISIWECDFGCVGLGTCEKACPYDAIKVKDGVAIVNSARCVGCGKCTTVCPKGLISLERKDKKVAVRCSNPNKGTAVKNVCSVGCLGCTICTKKCPTGAIYMNGNTPMINYMKCTGCGTCADVCPRGIINRFDN